MNRFYGGWGWSLILLTSTEQKNRKRQGGDGSDGELLPSSLGALDAAS